MRNMKTTVTVVSLMALALCAQAQTEKTLPATTETLVASTMRKAADIKKENLKAGGYSTKFPVLNPKQIAPGIIDSLMDMSGNCTGCYKFSNNMQTLGFLRDMREELSKPEHSNNSMTPVVEKDINLVKDLKNNIYPVIIIYVDSKDDGLEAAMYFPAGDFQFIRLGDFCSSEFLYQKISERGVKQGMKKKDFYIQPSDALTK